MYAKYVVVGCPTCKAAIVITTRRFVELIGPNDLLFFCDTDCYEVYQALDPSWLN